MEIVNTFNFKDNSWESFFFMDALTTIFEKNGYKNFDGENVEITLTINGIECPFVETLKYIGECFDKSVEQKAEEMIKEKVDDEIFNKIEKLSRITEEFQEDFQHKIEQLLSSNSKLTPMEIARATIIPNKE